MKRIYLKPVSKTLSLRLVASIAAGSGGTVDKIDDPNGNPYVIGDGNEDPENPDGGNGSRYLRSSMWEE